MVGDNDDRVEVGQIIERSAGHIQFVVASAAYSGEVRIVVGDDSAFVAQQLEDGQRRRLAQVVDVALVGQAQDQDLRALDRLAVFVESGGQVIEPAVETLPTYPSSMASSCLSSTTIAWTCQSSMTTT